MQQIQNVKTKMELMHHFCQYVANSKCENRDETHAAFSLICSKFKMLKQRSSLCSIFPNMQQIEIDKNKDGVYTLVVDI